MENVYIYIHVSISMYVCVYHRPNPVRQKINLIQQYNYNFYLSLKQKGLSDVKGMTKKCPKIFAYLKTIF